MPLEQSVAMLSSVLRSTRAVHVNILIIRAFVRLRSILAMSKVLAKKIDAMEQTYQHIRGHHRLDKDVLETISTRPKNRIGFRTSSK